MDELFLSEQEILRRESLKSLRDLGIDPFPADEFVVNATCQEILDKFDPEEKQLPRGIAGWPHYEPPHYGKCFFC